MNKTRIKTYILSTLVVIMIIGQAYSVSMICNLQAQIDSMQIDMRSLNGIIEGNMSIIYANIDERLAEEDNLIESAAVEIGTLNLEDVTIPLTFKVTPKEVRADTAVSLDVDGVLFPMEKKDTTFSTTISHTIFEEISPKIVIEENGVKKTREDDRMNVFEMKHSIFPTVYPDYSGQMNKTKKGFSIKGELSLTITPAETEIKEIRLQIKADQKEVANELLSYDPPSGQYDQFTQYHAINKEIPAKSGQTCTMVVIVTDTLGFVHHYKIDDLSKNDRDVNEWSFAPSHERIYHPDGTLTWEGDNQ